jgi:hypothetical protein
MGSFARRPFCKTAGARARLISEDVEVADLPPDDEGKRTKTLARQRRQLARDRAREEGTSLIEIYASPVLATAAVAAWVGAIFANQAIGSVFVVVGFVMLLAAVFNTRLREVTKEA